MKLSKDKKDKKIPGPKINWRVFLRNVHLVDEWKKSHNGQEPSRKVEIILDDNIVVKIGQWVKKQRNEYKKKEKGKSLIPYDLEKKRVLDEIDFSWDAELANQKRKRSYEEQERNLKNYLDKLGDRTFECDQVLKKKNRQAYNYVKYIRQTVKPILNGAEKGNKIWTLERIKHFVDLGVISQELWDRRNIASLLCSLAQTEINTNVPCCLGLNTTIKSGEALTRRNYAESIKRLWNDEINIQYIPPSVKVELYPRLPKI